MLYCIAGWSYSANRGKYYINIYFPHHKRNSIIYDIKTGKRVMGGKFIASDVSDTNGECFKYLNLSSSAQNVMCVVNDSIATKAHST